MRFVRKNKLQNTPEVSFVLMDWGCRESFHTLEYLNNQLVDRSRYEIFWIEYYDRQPTRLSDLIKRYEDAGLPSPIDTWLVMARPKGEIFRKHWINNLGILHTTGDIIVFMDSDAIVNPTLVDTIIKEFKDTPERILYMEEIRTADKSFYPFKYPNPKEIIPSAVNMKNGVPVAMRNFHSGLLADPSLIHCRNYGACFCARREDLIRIGGWDEHEDYTGYIAGPYEMSLRMELAGKKELWSHFELLYHTPHPGNSGIDNYSGPHDGKGVSTTAMKVLETKRLLPLVENPEIRRLRLRLQPVSLVKDLSIGTIEGNGNDQLTPTTPEKSTDVFIPPLPASKWDKKPFYHLAKFYDQLETRCFGYGYSRIYAIASYAAVVGKKLGLPQEKNEALYVAGLFCDMGKILELSRVNAFGARAEAAIGNEFFRDMSDDPAQTVRNACAMFREHYDGNGPQGVKGEVIPIEARIIAVAHKFDDMINIRDSSRKAMLFSEVYKSITDMSGTVFDPKVVDAFLDCKEDFVCINLKNQNNTLNFMYPCYHFDEKSLGAITYAMSYAVPSGASASVPVTTCEKSMAHIASGGYPVIDQFHEFNIYLVKDNGRDMLYAIPSWQGPLDIGSFEKGKYRFAFVSHDINEIKERINPQLLFQNFYGYNFIRAAEEYFAIRIGEVGFSIEKAHKGKYAAPCFIKKSLNRLKERVFIEMLRKSLVERVKVVAKKIMPDVAAK